MHVQREKPLRRKAAAAPCKLAEEILFSFIFMSRRHENVSLLNVTSIKEVAISFCTNRLFTDGVCCEPQDSPAKKSGKKQQKFFKIVKQLN